MTQDGLEMRALGIDVGVISKLLEAATRAIDPQRDVSSSEVIKLYLSHPDQIALFIAELDGDAVGFQSLKRASVPNMYNVPKHWGVIGSYVVPKAMRKVLDLLYGRKRNARRYTAVLQRLVQRR